jgi:hypothetical protein
MNLTTINDPDLIKKAIEMAQVGMFVSDISKELSEQSGKRITQMALLRLFNSLKEEPNQKLTDLDYPSRAEMENIFSEILQKENNFICVYGGQKLERRYMVRLIRKYHKTGFTYMEAKNELNKDINEDRFRQHIEYLKVNNFIELTENGNLKFCKVVLEWYNFAPKKRTKKITL